MKNQKYLLVFGSLRKNSKRGYNYNRFGEGSQKYIKDVILDGFEMFDLKYYPAICKGQGKIKCELHTVEDQAYTEIYHMEIGAGYSELKLPVEGVEASIFVWPAERLQDKPKVESGDWD